MTLSVPDRALLELVGGARLPDLTTLDASGWTRLTHLAELHRLGPLLYWRHGRQGEIPAEVRQSWHESYRTARIAALAQDADLHYCMTLLDKAGYSPVALKGAYLARHAYPDAALRPMRDIDVLVPRNHAKAAWDALLAAGCRPLEDAKIALEEVIRLEQHLPSIGLPRGTVLELHVRVSERSGRLEYATPAGREADLIARARMLEGLCYPDPTDLLAHLITHAVYGHRFDCGPLVLSDVAFLVARHPIDWPRLHATASADGWSKGAALVVELVREFCGDTAAPSPPDLPNPATRDLAAALLLQDWRAKQTPRFLAAVLTGGWRYALRRTSGTVAAEGETAISIDRAAKGGRLRWAARHLAAMWRDLRDPAVRRQTRQLAQFRRWIET